MIAFCVVTHIQRPGLSDLFDNRQICFIYAGSPEDFQALLMDILAEVCNPLPVPP